jgi:hypothetical protein
MPLPLNEAAFEGSTAILQMLVVPPTVPAEVVAAVTAMVGPSR